jgi:hypothetical protein
MLMLIALTGVLSLNVAPTEAVGSQPQLCHMEIAAGAKSRKCEIAVPAGRLVRACSDVDKKAGHCDPTGAHVAWVVGTGPGHCRISKKKTKWDRVVVAKLSKSKGAASSCDLYVELQ